MKLRRVLACCLVSATWLMTFIEVPVWAQEPFRLTPSARFLLGMDTGYLWMSGEMLVPAGGMPGSGSKVDLSSLGLEQGESVTIFLQGAILERHLINLDYLMASPTGLRRTPISFRFQNRAYAVDAPLETRLDLNWLRVSYGYKILDVSSFWVAPRFGVHHILFGATINGETMDRVSISNTRKLDGIYPVLGFEARYLFPYGVDLNLEMEGVHLITRGFLAMARLGAYWEIHPDIVITLGASTRFVNCVEDNQILNNEWSLNLAGLSAGLLFGF